MNTTTQKTLFWTGKIFIVFVFMYFGISSIFHPETFSRLIPDFAANIVPAKYLVMAHGGVEVICALFILFNLGGAIPGTVLIFSMLAVIYTVSGLTQIRDIGILGAILLLLSINLDQNRIPKITEHS